MNTKQLVEEEAEPQFVHKNGVRLWWDMDCPEELSLTAIAPVVHHKFDYTDNTNQDWEHAEDVAEVAMRECAALCAREAELAHPEWERCEEPVREGPNWLFRYHACAGEEHYEDELEDEAGLGAWQEALAARGITP